MTVRLTGRAVNPMSQPGPRELPAARVNRAAKEMYKQLRDSQGMADLWKDLKPETRDHWRNAMIAGLLAFNSTGGETIE